MTKPGIGPLMHGAIEVHHPSGALPAHDQMVHTEHVIAYIEEGRLDVECGTIAHATAGCLCAIPAGVPHRALGGAGRWWIARFVRRACSSTKVRL